VRIASHTDKKSLFVLAAMASFGKVSTTTQPYDAVKHTAATGKALQSRQCLDMFFFPLSSIGPQRY
jgi:hypothetical protein